MYGWPGFKPTQEHSTSVCDELARAKLSGRRWSSTTIASSGLMVLAGACGSSGLREAQNCAGVQVGEQPCLRRAVGERDGAHRFNTGWAAACGRHVGRTQSDRVIANAANNFRTDAERNRRVRIRGLERVAIQQLCIDYRAPTVAFRSSAKPQSSRLAA